MAYSFQGISTMTSALRAYQTQLDVTGENISNAETVGYHRRTATLSQAPSTSVTFGRTISLGNGVNVEAVTRVRDLFLAGRRNEAESRLGRGQEGLTGLTKVESSFMEPGSDGISAAYDAFNNAWSSLSASPNSAAAKADVQAAGNRLAGRVSNLALDLQSQRADASARLKEIVGGIDDKTAKVAALNDRIAEATAHGATPNDLMDERDAVVKELAGMADVTVGKGGTGYTVSLNGYRLVDASGANPIGGKYDAATGTIVDGNSSYPVRGGTLAGAFDTAKSLDATMAKLDAFADGLRTAVNGLFTTAKTGAGTTGVPFFAEPIPPATSVGAVGLRLSDPIAANPNAISGGATGLSGDGTLAAQISNLRDAKLLGGETLGAFYAGIVSDVGRQVATAKDAVDVQGTVAKQIDAQISETSGVSMDQEMANLLRFQRSYQAAAKALSTFDSMTETLINMLQR